jgi:peptide/nickel transport system permease protein
MAATLSAPQATIEAEVPVRSAWRRRARLLRHDPLGLFGGLVLLAMLFLAFAYPLLVPYDPVAVDPSSTLLPPSGAHWFGTDNAGRDVFSRVLAGSRVALEAAAVVLLIAVSVGVLVGSLAGYRGGWADEILMRITDMFLSFPPLLLAMAVNAGLGAGLLSTMAAVSLTWWPSYARMVRGQVLSLKERNYVEAAHAMGASHRRILARHLLPNFAPVLLIQATLDVGYVVLITSSLSFVGLGSQPPTPDWGAMVNDGRTNLLTAWWWSTFPGLAIALLATASNLFGDLLGRMLDPRGE